MPLVDAISIPRLSTYKTSFHCSDEQALQYYYWNQALSSEIYVLLHNIEVCLRNRIHPSLSLYVSELNEVPITENYQWYDYFYFDVPSKRNKSEMVLGRTGQSVESAKTKLRNRKMSLTPQNVISNIEFGTWWHILKTSHLKGKKIIEWGKINPQIFVHYRDIKNVDKRNLLMDRLREIGLLRNRMAHLEPVWKFKERKIGTSKILEPSTPEEIFSNLNQEVLATVRFLGWLCEETHQFYIQTQSFKELQRLLQHQNIENFKL